MSAFGWRVSHRVTRSAASSDLRHRPELEERIAPERAALAWWSVSIAVDDFETGYSSLSFLHALQVQMVKIDQLFVRQLATSHEDRLIIAAMAGLAERLDFELVAEGIDTPAHVSARAELGVPLGQGFLLAPPCDADSITHMLSTGWHADQSVTIAPALSGPNT